MEVAPRRGIFVATIDLLDHLDLLETRRQLDSLLMKFAVRRARAEHYENLRDCAGKMQQAAENKDTEEFLRQDRRFDAIVYEAARNHSAVAAVARLHHCRRSGMRINGRPTWPDRRPIIRRSCTRLRP